MLKQIYNALKTITNLPLYIFKSPKIDRPFHVGHNNWLAYLSEHFNKPEFRVLELGSRNVTGANFRQNFSKAEYVGFDYYAGENVDVVGDIHNLDEYFNGEKFDLIFCSAVFEHLYMPWVAAEKISSLLNVGGHVFVETHFSYVAHERPWNFFQFSDMGLKALFNDGLGFEVLDCGMSNPIVGLFNSRSDAQLRYRPVKELYCHSEILVRKYKEPAAFDWYKLKAEDLVGETKYPRPKLFGQDS